MEHARPKVKLDKSQRQIYGSLSEGQVLSLILPHMKRRTRLQGISGEMEAVIRALDTRLACLRVEIISWRKAQSLEKSLQRMNTARLVELILSGKVGGCQNYGPFWVP